jgi:hypothetical protein
MVPTIKGFKPPLVVAFVLLLGVLSCNMPQLGFSEDLATLATTPTATVKPGETQVPPSVTPEWIPDPSETPPDEPSVGPTMTPLAHPIEDQEGLSKNGPWLVYSNGEAGSQRTSLYIANPDGSGRRQIASGIISSFGAKMSPAGDRFAYLKSGSTNDSIPTLVILRVPGGEIEIEIPLVSADVMEEISDDGELEGQILTTVGRGDTFAWSPQGHYLAFVGALDEPSATLYRFDTWSDNIRRLTDSEQVFSPNWTPDGEWIVHLEGSYFGTPTDTGLTGMRAVSSDGSQRKALYSIQNDPLFFLGWLDNGRFLLSSETDLGRSYSRSDEF